MASAGPLRNVAEYTNEVKVDQVKSRAPLKTIENKTKLRTVTNSSFY
jgi:hypothetical protein